MTKEPRDKAYGYTVSESVALIPGDLPRDAVSLFGIIANGRIGFDFEGPALADFVRRNLEALMDRGARPVLGGAGTPYYWLLQPQYGTEPGEIVNKVMAEWLAAGMPDVDAGGLWFALPHIYEGKKVSARG